MKKTVSLIISMFLLLSSCGKIRELMNPTSDTSAQAKAAAEAQAKAAAQLAAEKAAIEKAATEAQAKAAAEAQAKAAIEPAGTQAPKEPEIKTPSESETKSDETTEEQEEENEEELTVEIPLSLRVARWTAIKTIQAAAIAAIAYGGYKSIRHAIGEENWNSIMKRLRGGQQPGQQNDNQQPAGQQNDNQQPAGQQNDNQQPAGQQNDNQQPAGQQNDNQPQGGGEGNVDEDSSSGSSDPQSDPQQPNSSPIYRYFVAKQDDNDYSDTSIQETVDKGDGVAFDIFNHAQKYGYPNNNLEAKRFKAIQPSNSGMWHWASRSGKLVKKENDYAYGAKVGLNDCSSDSSDWESS